MFVDAVIFVSLYVFCGGAVTFEVINVFCIDWCEQMLVKTNMYWHLPSNFIQPACNDDVWWIYGGSKQNVMNKFPHFHSMALG